MKFWHFQNHRELSTIDIKAVPVSRGFTVNSDMTFLHSR